MAQITFLITIILQLQSVPQFMGMDSKCAKMFFILPLTHILFNGVRWQNATMMMSTLQPSTAPLILGSDTMFFKNSNAHFWPVLTAGMPSDRWI